MIKFRFSQAIEFKALAQLLQSSVQDQQSFKISLNQLINSSRTDYAFVHRLMNFQEQNNIALDMRQILFKLRDCRLEANRQKQIVEVMKKYYDLDEAYFNTVFQQLLRFEELNFTTLAQMLYIALQRDFFQEHIPRICDEMICCDDIQMYDLMHFFPLYQFDNPHLEGLIEAMEDIIISQLISANHKYLRILLFELRKAPRISKRMQEGLEKYLKEQHLLLSQGLLLEFLNLVNAKPFENEKVKYLILQGMHLTKIKQVNQSLVNTYNVPSLNPKEQELLANLITLSGFDFNREYLSTYSNESNAKRREMLEEHNKQQAEIDALVDEVLQDLRSDLTFSKFYSIFKKVMSLEISMPELMIPLGEYLSRIVDQMQIGQQKLLEVLYYYEEANFKLTFNEQAPGFQHLIEQIMESPSSYNTPYLIRLFAHHDKYQKNIEEVLDHLSFHSVTHYVVLLKGKGLPQSAELQKRIQHVVNTYTSKSQIDNLNFYKCLCRMELDPRSLTSNQHIYNRGMDYHNQSSNHKTKNSQLEAYIMKFLSEFVPKDYQILQNQLVGGSEIDFIIKHKDKQLQIQVHGPVHYYHGTNEFNFRTQINSINFKGHIIEHHNMNQWYTYPRNAVRDLVKFIQ